MDKHRKQRLAIGAVLVFLIAFGFFDKDVKIQIEKSAGEWLCSFLYVPGQNTLPTDIFSIYPWQEKGQVTKVQYDPAKLQRENEIMMRQENETSDALALQNNTAVQSENVSEMLPEQAVNGTGGEVYVKKLWETKNVNYLWNHFYIVDSTTSVKKKLFPVERLLKRNMQLDVKKGKKQILIYHTHGASEAFADSRSGKVNDSVIGVGEELTKELEKKGYGVIHDKTQYDWMDGRIDRSKAYNASLEGVRRRLEQNPDIQVIIDLHRDSVGKNKHTYTMIDGKKTAIVMFFNGMSRSRKGEITYLTNPNREANLAFSLQLKCHAMELFEGFTKPIYLKGYRYNLHLKERSLLIELGNENNTVEEAKNAAAPLAKVIADVLKGEVKHTSRG
ncbi:MAG: stage II sporulation protein P [Eubacterium sp.]